MKKLSTVLLMACSLTFAQETQEAKKQVEQTKEQVRQAEELAGELAAKNYVPQVGFKLSLGTAATLGDQALQEPGFIASPAIFATMQLPASLYLTGEMAMSQYSVPVNDLNNNAPADLKLTTIDPTLLLGYQITSKYSLFLGPQINLLFQAEEEVGETLIEVVDDLSSPAFGLVVGAKHQYNETFFTDIRFNYGLTDIYENRNVTLYSLQLSAGLYI